MSASVPGRQPGVPGIPDPTTGHGPGADPGHGSGRGRGRGSGRDQGGRAGELQGGPAAWGAWGIGVAVYVLAVVHRTSLGVAGLDAALRFHIGASRLSTFCLLQVLVYAVMQIPAGLLVDRVGPRRVLSLGLVLLTAGQLGFAFSAGFPSALASRAVLGCGDAMTFVSVLRLGAVWFPPRRNPLMAQLTALVGMGGNLVSTAVLSRVLDSAGWTETFGVTGLVGIGLLAVVLLFLRDSPAHRLFHRAAGAGAGQDAVAPAVAPHPPVLPQIRAAWSEPGTRIGLWTHFTAQFPAMTFLLLWGEPFLVDGEGLSAGTAGTLLSIVVVSNMACGLLFGQLLSRRHSLRLPLVLTAVSGTGVLWAVVLSWPGPHAPLWLLTLICLWMGSNGSASIVGLDFARPVNPPERIGTASGIVNMGGFVATMFCLLMIGLLLDANSPAGGGHYPARAFHTAFLVLYVPMGIGISQILRLRRRAARREAEFRAGHAVAVSIPPQRGPAGV